MLGENISKLIKDICKKQKINYAYGKIHLSTLKKDAKKLGRIYLWLKEVMGTIQEIEERHNVQGLSDKFEHLLKDLDTVDHDIIRLAHQLKNNGDL
jgi:hypothetical protein